MSGTAWVCASMIPGMLLIGYLMWISFLNSSFKGLLESKLPWICHKVAVFQGAPPRLIIFRYRNLSTVPLRTANSSKHKNSSYNASGHDFIRSSALSRPDLLNIYLGDLQRKEIIQEGADLVRQHVWKCKSWSFEKEHCFCCKLTYIGAKAACD